MYDLAHALHVRVEQLLCPQEEDIQPLREIGPAFFQSLSRFYCYHFDGRNGKLTRSVFDVFAPIAVNRYKTAMYMSCRDLVHYQKCENTYWGYMEHFDSLSIIELTNQDNPMEKASLQILASFLDSETKWALWNGVSSRPLMPVAVKMLLSKKTARRGCGLENTAETLQRGHQPDEILQYVLRGINQQETADGAQCFIRRSYFKKSRRNDPAENNRIAGSLYPR